MLKTKELFDLTHTLAGELLEGVEYPWQAVSSIKAAIISIGESLDKNEYNEISKNVWVHKTAIVAPSAFLTAPCIVGAASEIRHCAFLRGSTLIGDGCVVGNSTELKNVILFDGVQVPHYNYVGDSILGYKAHMGAGAVTSNVKADRQHVVIHDGTQSAETGLRKCGAFLGDRAEIGCNAVLNPGTVIGRGSNVYPTACVRGTIPENCIFKNNGTVVKKEEK